MDLIKQFFLEKKIIEVKVPLTESPLGSIYDEGFQKISQGYLRLKDSDILNKNEELQDKMLDVRDAVERLIEELPNHERIPILDEDGKQKYSVTKFVFSKDLTSKKLSRIGNICEFNFISILQNEVLEKMLEASFRDISQIIVDDEEVNIDEITHSYIKYTYLKMFHSLIDHKIAELKKK